MFSIVSNLERIWVYKRMCSSCVQTRLFSKRDLTQTLVSNRILEPAPAVTEGQLYIVKLLVTFKKLHLKSSLMCRHCLIFWKLSLATTSIEGYSLFMTVPEYLSFFKWQVYAFFCRTTNREMTSIWSCCRLKKLASPFLLVLDYLWFWKLWLA